MPQSFRRFTELPDAPYRLGRHRVHDALPRELEAIVDLLEPIRTVTHTEYQPAFDQGDVGACTMNAAFGCLVAAPFGKPGVAYSQTEILAGYELETQLDDSQIPGQYPPNDTGSTGPWSMQALEKLGKVRSFKHARSLHAVLRLLNNGPVSIGVSWYQSMFTPDADHVIHVYAASGLAGGHQVCLVANDTVRRRVRVRNSWGTGWADQGHAWLTWGDLEALLDDGGDAVQPIL